MSALLVKKSLELVEDHTSPSNPKKPKVKDDIQKTKKYTVEEAKRSTKTKEQVLRSNLNKLEKIHQHSKVIIDQKATRQIIQRAISKRPIKLKKKKRKQQKSQTAFTEEDFKKFEEEYLNQ